MILEIIFGSLFVAIFILLIKWIQIYNDFQYLRQTINEQFSNIEIFEKQRYDMIMAIIQIAKKYNIHENTTFNQVSQARAHWDTKAPLNDRVRALAGLEDNYLKINAVVESYPDLKAELIQSEAMKNDVVIENKLADSRVSYNMVTKDYNFKVNFFPLSIIARVHHFEPYDFVNFVNQSEYIPQKIYGD